jgi:hypothetical protein
LCAKRDATSYSCGEGNIIMGLYLCIFDGNEDVDGVEVGPYADFNALRDYIIQEIEGGEAGS